ncbi:MAG: hypothetical protein JW860_06775 [Sedimentisphaerales bacterium]|nr:hypothetical protein [Sedimentisphaerales bacterium]
MKLNVTREEVWAAGLKDTPGALKEKLEILAQAGACLGFCIARRCHDKPGTGVVFVTPIKGTKQVTAAKKAGFKTTKSLHSLRIRTSDKSGRGAKITAAIAEAGINLRGLSAAAIGKKAVIHLAFDKAADATKAARVLKKL